MGIKLENTKSVYIELERDIENACIRAQWMGILEFQDIKNGSLAIIEELKQTAFNKLLHDNRMVIGDWRTSNDWLSNEWLSLALQFNLKKIAHILSPYYYGKLSAEELQSRIHDKIQIMLFETEEEAKKWLSDPA